MKRLHREDLYAYSVFNERLNIEFNSFVWVRDAGNVLIDPLPMSEHDRAHLKSIGGAAWIVITNSDHVRGTEALARELGAKVAGPCAEKDGFPMRCDRWLADGDEIVRGFTVFELEGSKTPGELALALEPDTLIFGDLVRAHRAGSLMFLPPEKLKDAALAQSSVVRVFEGHGNVDAVLVGDGWCVFRDGRTLMSELLGVDPDAFEPVTGEHRASDSGQFKIPARRSSIPALRAGSKCGFCDCSAADSKLVSGTALSTRESAAVCAACAARLECKIQSARCNFCDQIADETARERETTICRDCVELALAIFGDGDGSGHSS